MSLDISGSPFEIGLRLGKQGRDSVHKYLIGTPIFQKITSREMTARSDKMMRTVSRLHPDIYEEIKGLSQGLGLPFSHTAAWNCRGDLLSFPPDGCTTILLPGEEPVIGHNEDGLPGFKGSCFIARIRPETGTPFFSFCYPGSISGHTFCWNDAGLIMTVNNIRLKGIRPEMPRMVITRAVMQCETIAGVLMLIENSPASGGFHLSICCVRSREIYSVEFGGGKASSIKIDKPSAHSNHALHLDAGEIRQHITESSKDRQIRAEALLADGKDGLLTILSDTGGCLPIFRTDPDDPDEENTIASAVLRAAEDSVHYAVYSPFNLRSSVLSGMPPISARPR